MAKIFCAGEGRSFPEEQFLYNKDGSLFEPHIHRGPPAHFASTGEPPPGSKLHEIPGPLLARFHVLVKNVPHDEIERLLEDKLKA
jgi:hypothetical protein